MEKKSTKKGLLSKKKMTSVEKKDKKMNKQDKNRSALSDFERGYIEGKKALENSRLLHEFEMSRKIYTGQHNERNKQVNPQRRPTNLYGEQPESLGNLEYEGSHKKHSGLGFNNYIASEEKREDSSQNGNGKAFKRDEKITEKKDKNKKTRNQSDLNANRRLGETNIYFGNRDTRNNADRSQSESNMDFEHNGRRNYQHEDDGPADIDRDHDFQQKGHQYSGEVEGFGNRAEQQHGQDWIDQDYYRGGHSQTKRGHGRYGSR